MIPGSLKSLLLAAVCVLASQTLAAAQSGRRTPTPLSPLPAPTHEPTHELIDTTNFERFKLVLSRGIDDFVRDLNEQGRLSYRLEKSVSYGDRGEGRKYAAVLRLDPGHTYEYASDRLPNNVLYGHPFNYYARRGYQLVEAYPLTQCPEEDYLADPNDPLSPANSPAMKMLGTVKDNVLLFMRRDRAAEQSRDYKLFTGYLGLGDTLKELQAALDAAPPGFRPVRLILSTQGWFSFRVSVVAERDLSEHVPAKVEYQLVKERKDLKKEVNQLASVGARYVGGGRIEPFKVALLTRQAADASAYTFLDDDKAAKELDKLVAAGHIYQGMLAGDLTCDASDVVSQKLVFAREAAGPTRQYKLLPLPEPNRGAPTPPPLSELQRLTGENFHIRAIFYSHGLKVLLEK